MRLAAQGRCLSRRFCSVTSSPREWVERAARLAPRGPVRFPTVLGIESSCDDSGLAVVTTRPATIDGMPVLAGCTESEFLASQFDLHAAYGGVVPRLASRAHEVNMPLGVEYIREQTNGFAGVDALAVTAGPGLAVCLRVGFQTAVSLAEHLGVPLVKVNHLQAHILAARLASPGLKFPFLVFLASGGHTLLALVTGLRSTDFVPIASTLDDSLGEAFDKVARMVKVGMHCAPSDGLNEDDPAVASQPRSRTLTVQQSFERGSGVSLDDLVASSHGPPLGKPREASETVAGHLGAALERLADGAEPSIPLPVPLSSRPSRLAFSFSGLKSAIARLCDGPLDVTDRATAAAVAASFHSVVCQHLENQLSACFRQMREREVPRPSAMVFCGGVAANRRIRGALASVVDAEGIPMVVPPAKLCTDNGAMIAWLGAEKLHEGVLGDANWTGDFSPRWALGEDQPLYLPSRLQT
jgi:N6-L-threonylcarbamoyladenine synthase